MDQDTTSRKGAHVTILEAFGSGQADILLGTQMVSKGLDFPRVALVGVLQADVGLHIPDFRAAERTFQLLTQVAGRAGRADTLGEVVIQTYFPHDASIVAARDHDYQQFVDGEIGKRKELGYPPFCRLARVLVTGEDEHAVMSAIEQATAVMKQNGQGKLTLLGPAPAVLSKIKNVYRYSVLLKSPSPQLLQSTLSALRIAMGPRQKGPKLVVDVDPVNML